MTQFSQYELKQLLRSKINIIKDIANLPKVIALVKHHNKNPKSFEEIQLIDAKWQEKGAQEIKNSLLINATSQYLKKLITNNQEVFTEAFLTDKTGVNIALYPLTTDYLQSDEPKWQRAYNDGTGDIFITNFSFDESTQTNSLQICVPIMEDKHAIGVLIFGIKLTYLQAKILSSRSK